MTSFTRTWNSSYEALPPDAESARKGASRIREVKNDIRERMQVDHSWNGDQYDGQHSKVTMQALAQDPADPAGNPVGQLYCKLQSGVVELYFRDSNGNVVPLVSAVSGFIGLQPGTILPFANSEASWAAAPTKGASYVYCNGQAISRTDFPALFFAIGVIWGIGDGSNTFNVPDLRGRDLIGTGTGVQGGTPLTTRHAGDKGGEELHSLLITEIPGHQHTVYSNNGSNVAGSVFAAVQAAVQTSSFLTEMAGGDIAGGAVHAHNNMQPYAAVNWCIKT